MVSIIPRGWNPQNTTLEGLESQYENLLNARNRPELTALDKEALFESVLLRFKHCYKVMSEVPAVMLIRRMEGDPPKDVKRIYWRAIMKGCIKCSERWINEGDRLNLETFLPCSYDETSEGGGLAFVGEFIRDAHAMLESIGGTEVCLPRD